MRLSQSQEWGLAALLIAYIAFTDGFSAVRRFMSTSVGKVVILGVIVYVWKYVSALIALLLTINFLRCLGMREGVDASLSACPPGGTAIPDQPGKCRMSDGSIVTATTPTAEAPPTSSMPPVTPPPPAMTTPPPTAAMPTMPTMPTPPPPPPALPGMESFTPFMEQDKAGGCSFSPV